MSSPESLTFTTINMFNFVEPPNAFYDFENILTQDEWQKKQGWFKDRITELNSDVIGFQEVFSPNALKALVNELGYAYFCTVDEPESEDGYVFNSPVVAFASRYPILNAQPVIAEQTQLERFGIEFEFNRIPVHASIELPHLGITDCYVVHFKSQRPKEPEVNNEIDEESLSSLNQLHDEQLGSWLSTVQRGLEANILHNHIIQQRKKTSQAVVVMGDFNKPLFHDEFKGLLSHELRFDKFSSDYLALFQLKDSWDIYSELKGTDLLEKRAHTHYHGAKGSVLDYILLSNEFDSSFSGNILEIIDYTVTDKHIVNPRFDIDQFSTDHALVSITARIRQS
ncbi:endonuclease/exonuclease/phosphatase family protein [Aliivibrio fischeri]|uniref:endonuclease/exonuclease/phosphatase family protein n=1 Tax=Aliivibrio fischeri TaxID=668 RepID=UPI0018C631F2|nr:endonuclease/exonuclease/phosphatase family protein [Aliivibrio fischeri]